MASSVVAQGVVGPITTNNGVSACIQFGSCTTSGEFATTETQQAPISSQASSVNVAAPTNSAESAAYISNLAATGGAAAYSSRVANGQGAGGAADGITSVALTGTVIAGTSPAAASSTSRGGTTDASYKLDSGFHQIWTFAVAFVALIAGALVVL
ncbi:hypothetical protein CBS101457_003245 [Exobasidium rhododendri]|nr:hypothetical protein CBS101457_003245 [Exobasidium rhododendri]